MDEIEKILIVGDSLGLPREGMSYERTWPYLLMLSNTEHHFVLKLQRALTSEMINSGLLFDWLEFYNPRYVILQVGIVDCAPRYFRTRGFLIKLIGSLPQFLKARVWQLVKKYCKRSIKRADVKIEDFEINLRKYISRCEQVCVERIFLIKIAKPGSSMIKKTPGILKQVELYNSVFTRLAEVEEKCCVVDILSEATDSYFLEDGYHLNEFGNKQLFESLKKYFL
jgi:acyl-CoA thioesterase-1